MPEPVAAIDCGTNSVRLLIAEPGPNGPVEIVRAARIVRLGEGVDRTGRFAAGAIERTRHALAGYAEMIGAHGVRTVRMVATSATRDADNRAEFAAMVQAVLGVEPEVVTGQAEAELSFAGAVAGLPSAAPPVLVADIGGGSTELVLGAPGSRLRAHSMDIGSVRLTERHLHDDPPGEGQLAAAVADIDTAIDQAARHVPLAAPATFVGVAGTVLTVAALARGLTDLRPELIHGARVDAADVARTTARLAGMTRAERAALAAMHPGRADVIVAGALILDRLVHATGAAEIVTSTHDILDGIVLDLIG